MERAGADRQHLELARSAGAVGYVVRFGLVQPTSGPGGRRRHYLQLSRGLATEQLHMDLSARLDRPARRRLVPRGGVQPVGPVCSVVWRRIRALDGWAVPDV